MFEDQPPFVRHRPFWRLILVVVFAFLWAASPGQTGLAAESTCLNCHETQGQDPVNAQGIWHTEHNTADLCSVCHGGNPQVAVAEEAHQGLRLNPLENPETSCLICHPAEADEYIALYAAQLALTPTLENTAPVETSPPAPTTASPPDAATASPPASTPGSPQSSATTPSQITATTAPQILATAAPPALTTPTATVPPVVSQDQPPSIKIDWLAVLAFGRGPLFNAALGFFLIGMFVRLILILRLGWKHRRAPHKSAAFGLSLRNILVSFGRGLLVLPFIPGLKGAWRRSPVTYVAGGIFHLGLFAVIFFSRTHMLVWKSLIGVSWPILPNQAIAWLAGLAILAMLALLVNRLVDPVLRLISRTGEWLNWLLVFLPMLTGFILARRLWFSYEAAFAVHMLLVDLLLVWIPLSRISHFMFYFITRSIHGLEFGKRQLAG